MGLFGAINLARLLHFFTGKPVAGFDGQVTNCPDPVVHPKLTDGGRSSRRHIDVLVFANSPSSSS